MTHGDVDEATEVTAEVPAEERPAAAPVDPIADLVRVGQAGSGRRLAPVSDEIRQAIRDFATGRPLPGIGTLVDLARAHARGHGPALGVDAFSEIRRQLESLVSEIDAVAIHVGPVLFLKTRAKNQPGTELRWLKERERQVLVDHRELLDQPTRLAANLKKLLAKDEAGPKDDEEP